MGGRCAVAAAVTVWCGLALGAGAAGALVCLALLPPLAWLALRAPPRVGTALVLVALLLAAMARGGSARLARERGAGELEDATPPRWVRALVVEHPLREGGEPLAVVRLLAASPPLPAGTRARLRLPAGCPAEWGDTLAAFTTLERPPGRTNPGGYSPAAAAAGAGIAVQGRALAARVAPARGAAGWARATAVRWRRAVEGVLARSLSPASRQLVTPLVVGDRSALPPEVGADLRAAGLTHLLALSGLHVVWLAGIARGVAASAGCGVRGRALTGAACALVYLLVAGPLPSLARAAAAEWAGALARLVGRALDPVQTVGLCALALLTVAPAWAGDLGFQLSCAATLGLVTVGPWLADRAGRARALVAPFAPTVAAQAMALPLLVDRFHALPWTSLATNLVAVPVCGALLAAAWLGAGFECALPGAGALFLSACEPLAAALRGIARVAGRTPGALVATGPEPGIATLAAAGAGLLAVALAGPRDLAARERGPSRARQAAGGLGALLAGLALALAATAPPLRPPPGRWWLVALDVGQGDALALAFADGWWLVDAGPRTPRSDAGDRVVLPFLRWAGVRRLERLVVTHDDGDHAGGAGATLRGIGVGAIVVPTPVPGVPGPAPRLSGAGVPLRRVARGDTLRRDPAVVVLWPPAGESQPGDNAASLALAIGGERGRALLAADLDSIREARLGVRGPLAVLKVAHHGAASSSGAGPLAAAPPAVAVVSCGRRNAFGHPDAGALRRLRAAGAAVARTDREGAVWLELSAAGARRVEWRRGPPRAGAREDRPAPDLARAAPGW